MSKCAWLLIAAGVPAVLAAQTPASVQRAVTSITAQDVLRRIAIIADDSMLGRATPSPQLEQVARYIAAEFQRVGLQPGGESGTFFQRYPIEASRLTADSSYVQVTGTATVQWRLGPDASYYRGDAPAQSLSGPIIVVTGTPGSGSVIDTTRFSGAVVVFIALGGGGTLQRVLGGAHPAAILFAAALPEQEWAARAAQQEAPAYALATSEAQSPPIILVRESRALQLLTAAGATIDTTSAGRNRPLRVIPMAGLTARVRIAQRIRTGLSAPNVIGILEGSDPTLKSEYVFFTGHMDHLGTPGDGEGCEARGGDSICNGADDDGSGTIAVVKLAEAFAQLTPHPRRSLVFMTVSGEERGLWGSEYFSEHPTVPLPSIVADLNTDMIGRNWKDTIAVIGKEHSDLGATLNRVAAAHPELHMAAIDDKWPSENFYFRSDHYNFARKGVPILFFFNGTHPDYHQVSDEVAKIDAEKESRIIKLDFYLGLEVANRTARPKWNPESYRRIVQQTGN